MRANEAKPGASKADTQPQLAEAILAALRTAGKDLAALTPRDLAAVDQFHVRGLAATRDLAESAGLQAGERVLDAGGGLGGPARVLAGERGCAVEVLDLSADFCRAGALLTHLTGWTGRVRFCNGSALDLPYPSSRFDVYWTQHSTMNIANKTRLYAEARRVLRPGGRLAFYEIMAGPGGAPHYPVPWARGPEASTLPAPEAIRDLLDRLGLEEQAWQDDSEAAFRWFRERGGSGPRPSALGLHLVLGGDYGRMIENQVRNLAEGRIRVIRGVFSRSP
jgi:SAM-dependent methyltransferase